MQMCSMSWNPSHAELLESLLFQGLFSAVHSSDKLNTPFSFVTQLGRPISFSHSGKGWSLLSFWEESWDSYLQERFPDLCGIQIESSSWRRTPLVCVFCKFAQCLFLLSVSWVHLFSSLFLAFFLYMLFRELHISPGFVDPEMSQASKILIGLGLLPYQLFLSQLENRRWLIIHSKWWSDHSILT